MTSDREEIARICGKLEKAATNARAKYKWHAKMFGDGGGHHLAARRLNTEAAALIRRLQDENTRLTAQLEKAREALKPFAKLHDDILECCKQYAAPDNDPENWSKTCQWDDLGAAARVHAELAEKEKE